MARFAESLGNSPKSSRITWRNQIQRRIDSFKMTHFYYSLLEWLLKIWKKGSETGSHHNDSSSTAEVLKEVSSISQSDLIIFLFSIILYVTKYGHIRCIDYNNNFFHYVYETKHRERPIQVFRKSLRLFLRLFRADPHS